MATDAGGAKRVGKLAALLNVPMAIIDKRRTGDTVVKQGLVVGDVNGKDAIIFDDEISTGSTLVATARTLMDAGVNSMIMGVTHPVLCGNAPANLAASKVDRFVAANTVHVDETKMLDQLNIISVAPLMAEAIKRIHTGESVGALFDS